MAGKTDTAQHILQSNADIYRPFGGWHGFKDEHEETHDENTEGGAKEEAENNEGFVRSVSIFLFSRITDVDFSFFDPVTTSRSPWHLDGHS